MATARPTLQARLVPGQGRPERSFSERTQRAKSSTRSNSTSYALAYPAPVFSHKTHIVKHLRPRLYLQLQLISQEGRHYNPAIDVLSLAPLSGAKKMVSILKTFVKKLGSHKQCTKFAKRPGDHLRDVLLVEYLENEADSGLVTDPAVYPGPERLVDGSVAAVLRPNDEIVTKAGHIWAASEKRHRYFQFETTKSDGEHCIARWVPSKSHKRKTSSPTGFSSPPRSSLHSLEISETAFNFSRIDPTTRRHAILATLTSSGLEIKETYHDPNSTPSPGGSDDGTGQAVHVVDFGTRNLILATAVWLVLYLGWSPSYEATHS